MPLLLGVKFREKGLTDIFKSRNMHAICFTMPKTKGKIYESVLIMMILLDVLFYVACIILQVSVPTKTMHLGWKTM